MFCYQCGAMWKSCSCPYFPPDMQVDRNQPVIPPEAPRLKDRIQEERRRERRNEEQRLAEDARRRRAQRERGDELRRLEAARRARLQRPEDFAELDKEPRRRKTQKERENEQRRIKAAAGLARYRQDFAALEEEPPRARPYIIGTYRQAIFTHPKLLHREVLVRERARCFLCGLQVGSMECTLCKAVLCTRCQHR
jgi:hypothetical protein